MGNLFCVSENDFNEDYNYSLQMKQPNILLFFPDQMRGDWTELNPKLPILTPNLKKLADSGVFFSQAYCPSPLCSPSRSCLAVGKDYDNVDIINNGQNHPFDDPTFYEILRNQAGYHTMTCGKLDLRHPEHSYGNDGKHIVNGINYLEKWGFSDGVEIGGKKNGVRMWKQHRRDIGPYIMYLKEKDLVEMYVEDQSHRKFKDAHPSILENEDYVDNWIGRSGLELLKAAPRDKPWFIQVNFNGPHNPLDATKNMLKRWESIEDIPMPVNHTRFPREDNLQIRRNYGAEIENIDAWIPKFLDLVKERGELDNTIIIFASDHGEMLGDQDRVAKSVPFQGAIHVPLFISGPGIKKQPAITKPVNLIDLFSTILDFAGIKPPEGVDSVSLKPVLEGKEGVQTRYIRSGLNHFRVVIENNFKLVIGYKPSNSKWSKYKRILVKKILKPYDRKEIYKNNVQLFNLDTDPGEIHNIAKEHPEIVKRLLEIL